jgi:hypothetical protein
MGRLKNIKIISGGQTGADRAGLDYEHEDGPLAISSLPSVISVWKTR